MFRIIAIIGFASTVGGIGLHCIALPVYRGWRWNGEDVVKRLIHLVTLLFVEQKLNPAGVLRKLVYLLGLLSFVVLALTGFVPLLILNKHISGYLMMVHATFAPVFAVCLAALAVMWSRRCCFESDDWSVTLRIVERVTLAKQSEKEVSTGVAQIAQKATFWLLIMLSLPLILSVLLSMFPLFGTVHQEVLLGLHRCIALVFALLAITHTYVLVRTQMK